MKPARRAIETLLTIPWALRREWIDQMLAIASREHYDPKAIAAELGQPLDNSRTVTVREGVARIPVSGPMFRHANLFSEISGATSYDVLATDLTAALNDPQVRAIILDVDSPGGEVFGAAELSDLIFNARGEKPIYAHVNGFGCSAAYWIASAADKVIASSTGVLGSLGVSMSVTQPGDQPAEDGSREIQFVSSQTPNKNIDPTSKAGKEQNQAVVDQLAGVFLADVARNRGVREADVIEQFGAGGVMVGKAAVLAGLANAVGTFEATHQFLAERTLDRTGLRMVAGSPAKRPAATSGQLIKLLSAVGLEDAIRSARSKVIKTVIDATGKPIDSADTIEAALQTLTSPTPVGAPPAPKAEHQEAVMSDQKPTAAPDAGAELAKYKARVTQINNLCAAAGMPEKAGEFIDSELSEADVGVKLFEAKKKLNPPDPLGTPNADPNIRVGADREAEKPFSSLGEQLSAIAASYGQSGHNYGGFPGGVTDKRLPRIAAAVSGASTQVGGDGGWLIQKDFTVDLMKEGFESGALASRCSTTPIGPNADGLEVVQIDEKSRATGSRWGGVQIYRAAEADTVTAKKPKTQKWELRLEDLMGLAYMTERLLQDAPAMGAVFQEAFRDEFAFVLDDEIFRGTGVGQCLGVLNAPVTVSQAKETGQTADTVWAENIGKMWARVLPRSKARGFWFINTEVNPQLDQLQIGTGTSGQLVYMPPGGLSGASFGTIKGRPVIEIEQASALGDVGDISFLDLTQFKVITKGGIQAADSIHVRFINNERTFRWVSRVNGAPKFNSAITPYKGANTLSPFVTLAARA